MSADSWFLWVFFTVVNGAFFWWSMRNLNRTIALGEQMLSNASEREREERWVCDKAGGVVTHKVSDCCRLERRTVTDWEVQS